VKTTRFGRVGSSSVSSQAMGDLPITLQKHTTICLMGVALDSGDLGVVALSTALVGLVRQFCPDARIVLLVEHPSGESQTALLGSEAVSVDVVNAQISRRVALRDNLLFLPLLALYRRVHKRLRPHAVKPSRSRWVETVEQATWVGDIQGGDGFTDERGFLNFVAGCLPMLTAIAAGRPPYLLPQSLSPCRSAPGRALMRFVAARTRGLFGRDLASVQVGIALAGRFPAPPVELCHDIAFTLPVGAFPADAVSPALTGDGPIIGININGGMYSDGFRKQSSLNLALDYAGYIPELILALLAADPTARILLIPHTAVPAGHPESDADASDHVIAVLPEALRSRLHVLRGVTDPCRIKAAIGRCEFFIGSRLHACIAALSQGIPTVGIADNWRFEGVFNSTELHESVVEARLDEVGAALRFAMKKYGERAQTREKLIAAAEQANKRVREVFATLLAPSRRPF